MSAFCERTLYTQEKDTPRHRDPVKSLCCADNLTVGFRSQHTGPRG